MAEARARIKIIVEGKEQAQQQFEAIFNSVVQGSAKTLTAQQALTKTNELGVKWLREQANAATNAARPNYQLAKSYTDMANGLVPMNQGFRIFGMNIVDIAAKLYLIQTGIRNTIAAIQAMFILAELGAKTKQAALSFDMLHQSIGFSTDLMEQLRVASRGLMTDYELQNKVAAALSGTQGKLAKEFAAALPSILEYAIAAKTLKPEIENIDYVYNKLILGVRRGSPRLIDDANIVIKVAEAYQHYREELGLASNAILTAEQQQIAVLHEMQRGGEVIKEQAGNVGALTDRYGQLRTQVENARQGFGEFLDSALGPTIDEIAKDVGVINDAKDSWNALGESLAPVVQGLYEIWKIYIAVVPNIFMFANAATKLTHVENQSVNSSKDLSNALIGIGDSASDSADQMEKWGEKASDSFRKFRRTQVDILIKAAEDRSKYYQQISEAQDKAARRELQIVRKLNADKEKSFRDYTERVNDLNEQFAERQRDIQSRIEDVQRDRLVVGLEHAVTAASRRFSESRSLAEWDDIKSQLFAFNIPQSARSDLMVKIIESQIDSLSDYKQVLENIKSSQGETMSPEALRGLETQIADINANIVRLDQERFDKQRELDYALLDERQSLLQRELSDADVQRSKALERAKSDYDTHLSELQISANLSFDELRETTQATVSELNLKIAQIAASTSSQLKEALIDIGLGIVEAGSLTETELLEWKAMMHGVVLEGMVPDVQLLINKIQNDPDSLVNVINRIEYTGEGIKIPVSLQTEIAEAQFRAMTIKLSEIRDYYHGIGDVNLPRRQHGGSVMPGRPYIIGEDGPELFVSNTSGTIIPNGTSGGSFSVNIHTGAFLGSHSDAVRLGEQLLPILSKALQRQNINIFATGSRATSSNRLN